MVSKIGIFDSGLGGLIIARAIKKLMPEYDYVYLGDTKRVPYGNRSHETVYEFTCEALDYLFKKENCALVILACNTASARALSKIQKEFLPKNFPDRKVLGVLIPSAEECAKYERVGVLATRGTVASNSFPDEIRKISENVKNADFGFSRVLGSALLHNRPQPDHSKNQSPRSLKLRELTKVFQNPAPMLVPLAEEGENALAREFLKKYLKPLLTKNIDALALGCTHYPIFKKEIKKIVGRNIKIISQDEIVPKKLKDYLARHKEFEKKLSKKSTTKILVTDITRSVEKLTQKWFGKNAEPRLVDIN